jgi:hypothetical protein
METYYNQSLNLWRKFFKIKFSETVEYSFKAPTNPDFYCIPKFSKSFIPFILKRPPNSSLPDRKNDKKMVNVK